MAEEYEGLETEPLPDEVEDTPEEIEEDDDAGTEADDGDEGEGVEPEPEPVRQQSRGETRVQKLANEKRRLEQELAEERARKTVETSHSERLRQEAEQARRDAEERQRVEAMSPDERVLYNIEKRFERSERQSAQIAFEAQDRSDRAEFQAKAASNKLYAGYADRVEKELQTLRVNRQNAPREAILDYLVGKDVRTKSLKGISTAKETGARKVQAAKAQAPSGRGNTVQSTGGVKSLEKRLEGMEI